MIRLPQGSQNNHLSLPIGNIEDLEIKWTAGQIYIFEFNDDLKTPSLDPLDPLPL